MNSDLLMVIVLKFCSLSQELCWIHNTHNSDITSHLSNTLGTYEIFKFFLIKAFFLIFSIPGNLCL